MGSRTGAGERLTGPYTAATMTAPFLGLDLAWSDHHPTGACALDAQGRVIDDRLLGDDDSVVAWVARTAAPDAVVAADIPLHVPNSTGSRPCDRALASVYGGRRAGPHPANRSLFLHRYGRIRGEDLSDRLRGLGFAGPWDGSPRVLFETYPHPGLVEVFGLPERLAYKKGALEGRRRGLRTLRSLLRRLEHADPPLRGPLPSVPRAGTGRSLKAVEDRLDAHFCAWSAAVWSRYGEGRVRLFGDRDGGHIGVVTAEAP